MSEPFIGEIRMFGGTFAPRGWMLCNGQILAISSNQALFAILGTTYGGDGTATFQLPNLQGRIPMHWGNGPGLTPRTIGETGGGESTSVTINQMPPHTHTVALTAPIAIPVNTTNGDSLTPSNTSVLSQTVDTDAGAVVKLYSPGPGTTTLLPFQATASGQTAVAGNGLPVPTVAPFQCVSFIIALVGIFPSRN